VVLVVVAAVNMEVYLSTIVLYFKGKAIRVWLLERDILGSCGLA